MIAIYCQFFAVLSRGIRRLLVGSGYHNARHQSAMEPIGDYLSSTHVRACLEPAGLLLIISLKKWFAMLCYAMLRYSKSSRCRVVYSLTQLPKSGHAHAQYPHDKSHDHQQVVQSNLHAGEYYALRPLCLPPSEGQERGDSGRTLMLLMVMRAGTMKMSRQPNMAPLMLTTKPTSLSTRASRVTTESTPIVIGPAAASRSRPDS